MGISEKNWNCGTLGLQETIRANLVKIISVLERRACKQRNRRADVMGPYCVFHLHIWRYEKIINTFNRPGIWAHQMSILL